MLTRRFSGNNDAVSDISSGASILILRKTWVANSQPCALESESTECSVKRYNINRMNIEPGCGGVHFRKEGIFFGGSFSARNCVVNYLTFLCGGHQSNQLISGSWVFCCKSGSVEITISFRAWSSEAPWHVFWGVPWANLQVLLSGVREYANYFRKTVRRLRLSLVKMLQ